MAPKQFFDLQTPINFLTKKRNFANVKEINRRQFQPELRNSISCPYNIWFHFEISYPQTKIIRNQGSLTLQQKKSKLSIYQSRKEMIAELTKYRQRASSPNPSRKQKRFHNLNFIDSNRNEKLLQYLQSRNPSPFKQSQSLLDDSRQNQSFSSKSQEFNFKRMNSVKPNSQGKLPYLKKLKLKTDTKEFERQNSELMNTSINQASAEHFDPILEMPKVNYKKMEQKKIQQASKNKFLNDSYRLYGLDSEYKGPQNKLNTDQVNKFNKTSESQLNRSLTRSKEISLEKIPQDKKQSSKERLTSILKQSHTKLIERLFQSPQLSKINRRVRNSEEDTQRDQTIIFSYFPKTNSPKKKTLKNI